MKIEQISTYLSLPLLSTKKTKYLHQNNNNKKLMPEACSSHFRIPPIIQFFIIFSLWFLLCDGNSCKKLAQGMAKDIFNLSKCNFRSTEHYFSQNEIMSSSSSGEILTYGAFHISTSSLNLTKVSNNQSWCIRRLWGNLYKMSQPSQPRSYSSFVHQNKVTANGSYLPFCQ